MQKHIEIAKKISKELDKNWLPELKEMNLYKPFESIYKLSYNISVLNTLVCAIIYSYSPESKWIELKQDGFSINKNILKGLNVDFSEPIFNEFCELSNKDILDCVGEYLDIITNWKFVTIRKMIDFHSKTMSEKEPDLKEVDEEKKPKVRENISKTMREAVFQRNAADQLIQELEKEYVNTNHKTTEDFGTNFIQTSLDMGRKIDPMSWRDFIRTRNASKITS
jgi:hypothetical protein